MSKTAYKLIYLDPVKDLLCMLLMILHSPCSNDLSTSITWAHTPWTTPHQPVGSRLHHFSMPHTKWFCPSVKLLLVLDVQRSTAVLQRVIIRGFQIQEHHLRHHILPIFFGIIGTKISWTAKQSHSSISASTIVGGRNSKFSSLQINDTKIDPQEERQMKETPSVK